MSHGFGFDNFSDNLNKNYNVVLRYVRYPNIDGNVISNDWCSVRCLQNFPL